MSAAGLLLGLRPRVQVQGVISAFFTVLPKRWLDVTFLHSPGILPPHGASSRETEPEKRRQRQGEGRGHRESRLGRRWPRRADTQAPFLLLCRFPVCLMSQTPKESPAAPVRPLGSPALLDRPWDLRLLRAAQVPWLSRAGSGGVLLCHQSCQRAPQGAPQGTTQTGGGFHPSQPAITDRRPLSCNGVATGSLGWEFSPAPGNSKWPEAGSSVPCNSHDSRDTGHPLKSQHSAGLAHLGLGLLT